VVLGGNSSNNIETDQNGSGTTLLQMAGLTYNGGASVNFIGGGTALSANGSNEITFIPNILAYPGLTMELSSSALSPDQVLWTWRPRLAAPTASPSSRFRPRITLPALPPSRWASHRQRQALRRRHRNVRFQDGQRDHCLARATFWTPQDATTTLTVQSGVMAFSERGSSIGAAIGSGNQGYLNLQGGNDVIYAAGTNPQPIRSTAFLSRLATRRRSTRLDSALSCSPTPTSSAAR